MPQPKALHALLSLSDKTGLLPLATFLTQKGFSLIATTGTAAFLDKHALPCQKIEELYRGKEILGGRVKSLQYEIFAGILANRDHPNDMEEMRALEIPPIDLVVCNLYPFKAAVYQNLSQNQQAEDPPKADEEWIDIGGVSLIRAAAKNHKHVYILSRPEQYAQFMAAYPSRNLAQRLAADAYGLTAQYDLHIAAQLQANQDPEPLPAPTEMDPGLPESKPTFRYGENPHQQAWTLSTGDLEHFFEVKTGQISSNNLFDLHAARELILDLQALPDCHVATIIKHSQACGVAAQKEHALVAAWESDPTAAFGGVVVSSGPLLGADFKKLGTPFVDIIAAPDWDADLEELYGKKKRTKLIRLKPSFLKKNKSALTVKGYFDNELFLQEKDQQFYFDPGKQPALYFGEATVKSLLSNAVCICHETQLVGAGSGLVSRIDATELAVSKAKRWLEHSNISNPQLTVFSDAFFPFADSIEALKELPIQTIVQPGGSIRDPNVLQAAELAGMEMVLTGIRHFRH